MPIMLVIPDEKTAHMTAKEIERLQKALLDTADYHCAQRTSGLASTGCDEACGSVEKKAFRPDVMSDLGREMVDIVNVLRGLGSPEDSVVEAVSARLGFRPWKTA